MAKDFLALYGAMRMLDRPGGGSGGDDNNGNNEQDDKAFSCVSVGCTVIILIIAMTSCLS